MAPFENRSKKRRCLVPVVGFYEWPRPDSSEFDDRKPYYITLTEDRPLLFAGIWDCWDKAETIIESFSIITVPANTIMSTFHDRMPAIIDGDNCSTWLDPEIEDQDLLKGCDQTGAWISGVFR